MKLPRIVAGAIAILLVVITAQPHDLMAYSGKKETIIFTKQSGKMSHIWKMRADGSHKQLFVENAHSPKWSPSGHMLAFINAKTNTLQIVSANGESRQQLTNGRNVTEGDFSWSADGSNIALVRNEKTRHGTQSMIAVVNVYSKAEQNLTGWLKNGEYR